MEFKLSLFEKDKNLLTQLESDTGAMAKRFLLALSTLLLIDDFHAFTQKAKEEFNFTEERGEYKSKVPKTILPVIDKYISDYKLVDKLPQLGADSERILRAVFIDYICFEKFHLPKGMFLTIDSVSDTVARKGGEIAILFNAHMSLPELKEAIVASWPRIEQEVRGIKRRQDLLKIRNPERINRLEHARRFNKESRLSVSKNFVRDLCIYEYFVWLQANPEFRKAKYVQTDVKQYVIEHFEGQVLDESTIGDIMQRIKNQKIRANKRQ